MAVINYPPNFIQECSSGSWLLLDTGVLINSIKREHSDANTDFFGRVLNAGDCQLVTIPSVTLEFTRGVATIDDYRNRQLLLKTLKIVVLDKNSELYSG